MDTSRYEHDKNKNAVLMGFNFVDGRKFVYYAVCICLYYLKIISKLKSEIIEISSSNIYLFSYSTLANTTYVYFTDQK